MFSFWCSFFERLDMHALYAWYTWTYIDTKYST